MFHDMGLTHQQSSACERFEVDGANAASAFLQERGIARQDIDTVWTSIALHTTLGIPRHMHPVIALVTAGVEMDVLGFGRDFFAMIHFLLLSFLVIDGVTRCKARSASLSNRTHNIQSRKNRPITLHSSHPLILFDIAEGLICP
jgi:hypothetical protein